MAAQGAYRSYSDDAHRGYLDEAVARTRLPIFVTYGPGAQDSDCFYCWTLDGGGRWDCDSDNIHGEIDDPAEFTRVYLSLASKFLPAGPSATPPGSAQLAAGAV